MFRVFVSSGYRVANLFGRCFVVFVFLVRLVAARNMSTCVASKRHVSVIFPSAKSACTCRIIRSAVSWAYDAFTKNTVN